MKLYKLLLSTLIAITCSHVYAASGFSIGSGFLNGITNRTATLSLSTLLSTPDTYTIACTINDTKGNTDFTQIQVEIHTDALIVPILLDGYQLPGPGLTSTSFIMMDDRNHIISMTLKNGTIKPDSNINLSWAGTNGDKSIPINYSCNAVGSTSNK